MHLFRPKVYEGGMNMLPVHGMVYVFRWLCNVIERGQASLTSQTEKKKKISVLCICFNYVRGQSM